MWTQERGEQANDFRRAKAVALALVPGRCLTASSPSNQREALHRSRGAYKSPILIPKDKISVLHFFGQNNLPERLPASVRISRIQ